MSAAIVIADAVTAAGFRLTGVETLEPEAAATAATFADAWGRADLVVLTADCAARLPASVLEAAMVSSHPILAIVPDVRDVVAPPDLAARMKSVLGIES